MQAPDNHVGQFSLTGRVAGRVATVIWSILDAVDSPLNLQILVKTNRFYLEDCTLGDQSRIFFTEIDKTWWIHIYVFNSKNLSPTLQDLEKVLSVRMCELMKDKVYKVWWRYLQSFLRYRKIREGVCFATTMWHGLNRLDVHCPRIRTKFSSTLSGYSHGEASKQSQPTLSWVPEDWNPARHSPFGTRTRRFFAQFLVSSVGENRERWDTKCPVSPTPSGEH